MRFRVASGVGLVAGVVALAGCGGDDALAPPVPTTLEIVPAQVELKVGATEQLRARVLDQRGAEMTGAGPGPVVWASSDTTRVTIDATGLARGMRPGAATLSATAGALRANAQASVPGPQLNVESARAVRRRLGPAGGIIDAESSAGVRFSLDVPPGALLDTISITLTPVGSIGNSPFENVLGAVRMEPDGLVLLEPARLRIATSGIAEPGKVYGIHLSNDGAQYSYTPVRVNGAVVTVPVPHFSAAAAASATASLPPPSGRPEDQFLVMIANELVLAAVLNQPPDINYIASLFRQWHGAYVVPALSAAISNITFPQRVLSFSTWRFWLQAITGTGLGTPLFSLLATEMAAAEGLAATALRAWVDQMFTDCRQTRFMTFASYAFVVQYDAAQWGLDTVANGLDAASVLNRACVSVDIDAVLPPSLPSGQNADLTIQGGVKFGNQPPVDPGIEVTYVLLQTGTTNDGTHRPPWQGPATRVPFVPQGDVEVYFYVVGCIKDRVNPPYMLDVDQICDEAESQQDVDPYYEHDFESAVGTEWTRASRTTAPSGAKYLGSFQNEVVNLVLNNLPDHSQVRISFKFHTMGDWEGSEPVQQGGQDIMVFALDGAPLKQTTFSTKPGFKQAYPGNHPGGTNGPMTGAIAISSLGYPNGSGHTGDATYVVTLTAQHTGSRLVFAISGDLDDDDPINGERWGIDDITVVLIR